jgi:hypothetical protein
VVIEARLPDLHQRESVFEVGHPATIDRAERQLPTFVRASQNVAVAATRLDTLPAPFTDRVGEVYQWLKNILGTTTA